MKRRSLLVAMAFGSTGCLASASSGSGSSTERNETDTRQTETVGDEETQTVSRVSPARQNVEVEFRPEEHSEVESVQVGDGVPSDGTVRPHKVVVWNDGPKRDISITIESTSENLTVSRTSPLAKDEYVTFQVTEQVGYRITVGAVDGELYRFALSDGIVDCNGSQTTVRVPSSGRVEYLTVSTAMACLDQGGIGGETTVGR